MIIKRKSRVCLQFTLFWFSSVVIFLSPYCPQIIWFNLTQGMHLIIIIIIIIMIVMIIIIKRESRVCLQSTLFWLSSVVLFLSSYWRQIILFNLTQGLQSLFILQGRGGGGGGGVRKGRYFFKGQKFLISFPGTSYKIFWRYPPWPKGTITALSSSLDEESKI